MKTRHQPILSSPVTQSGDQKLNNPIRRKWSAVVFGGFLFTSIFALSAAAVEAQCPQWDVSGQWVIQQGSYSIRFTLSQNGKTIWGTAQQFWTADHQVKVLQGRVTGTVDGGEFNVQTNWDGGGAGVYRGSVAKLGTGLFGTTYDRNHLQSTASWSTDHQFKCADAAPAAAATPKPPKSSGKFKPATTPLPVKSSGHMPAATPTPAPTPSAEADESSSNDTEDQHGKHKKNKKNKKKHHHHDDDQEQGNN